METDDGYDSKRISKEIENTNIETALLPLSEEQRDQEVRRVLNELTSIAREPKLEDEQEAEDEQEKMSKKEDEQEEDEQEEDEQEAQPFNIDEFKQQKADAELATSLNSHPNLYYAIMNAGKIFEEADDPSLNRRERRFHCKIRRTRDIENLFKAMVEGLRILTFGPEVTLLLNSEDLVIAFSGCIKACLESVTAHAEERTYIAFPIVKQRSIAWVHYDFHSTRKTRTSFFRTTHIVDINVVQKYFYFTSEFNFKLNLFEAERRIKKAEAERKAEAKRQAEADRNQD